MRFVMRIAIAVTLAVSAAEHTQLYLHGYRHIPVIGDGFLWQASIFGALAILVLAGGPAWLIWSAGVLATGSLGAFALSRTVGLFGFTESGWNPVPHAALSVAAECATVVLCTVWIVHRPGRAD